MLDPIALATILIILTVSAITNVMFCEAGHMVGNRCVGFSDAIGQCKWYLFPIKIQQMLIIVMANSQNSTPIHGFGNILCSRETFKKVIN